MPTKVERFRSLPRSVLVMQRSKMTSERMAELAGVSVELVRKVLREHGIHGRHGNARLTEDKVRRIRADAARGVPQKTIAVKHRVDYSTINRIVNGLEWKWVK